MSENPVAEVMTKGGKATGKAKGVDVKKFTEEVLGDAAKYQEHIEKIHGGREALQAQAEKNNWSIEEQYQYAHGLQEEEAEKNNWSIDDQYEYNLLLQKEEAEKNSAGKQASSKLAKEIEEGKEKKEEVDSKAAEEIEVKKEEDEDSQKAELERIKEIQDIKSNLDNQKSQLKQKFEDQIRTARSAPPKYAFFSGGGFFLLLAAADFVLTIIPGGFLLEMPLFIIEMIGWLIPSILLRSPQSIIPIFIFYLIDYLTSLLGNVIPVWGAIIDLLPEFFSWKVIHLAPNQIIAKAEERFVEIKIHVLEDKFRASMHNLDQRYQRAIKRVNDLFNKKRFRMPSFDVDNMARNIITILMLFLAGVLTWFKVIGISFDAIHVTQLLLTGFFLTIFFFMQKVGLVSIE